MELQNCMTDMLSTLASGFGDKALMLVDKDGTPAGHILGTEMVGAMEYEKSKRPSPLPDEYTQLLYIESQSGAYIDTGIKVTDANRMVACFSYTVLASNTLSYVAGSRTGSANQGVAVGFGVYAPTHGGFTYYPASWVEDSAVVIQTNRIYIFDSYIGDSSASYKFNGIQRDSRTVSILKHGTNTFGLFCLYSGGIGDYIANGLRIYYSQMYNEDTLVQSLIPAKRNSDNEVGMYDLVSNTFLTNAGTGTFSYGEL